MPLSKEVIDEFCKTWDKVTEMTELSGESFGVEVLSDENGKLPVVMISFSDEDNKPLFEINNNN